MTTQRLEVDSTAISAMSYDAELAVLSLTFHNGRTYSYRAVPTTIWTQLLVAESVGTYFNDFIRNRFDYSRVA
ncbi:MAG: KTSC domain-containing protein [Chitinophagales bacterium]